MMESIFMTVPQHCRKFSAYSGGLQTKPVIAGFGQIYQKILAPNCPNPAAGLSKRRGTPFGILLAQRIAKTIPRAPQARHHCS
jgi:hypothetical protein